MTLKLSYSLTLGTEDAWAGFARAAAVRLAVRRADDHPDLLGNGPNAADLARACNRPPKLSLFAQDAEPGAASPAERAMHFMHGLSIPEGPNAGKPVQLAPFQCQFVEGALAPDIQMRITRKTLKQSGAALEQAVRRDMGGAMGAAMDQAAFLGTGANGQPLGVISGAATYGITSTAVDALAEWAAFRAGVTRFMTASAANAPGQVRGLVRPELWDYMEGKQSILPDLSEWDRLLKNIPAGNIAMTNNALAAPSGSPLATSALLTTAAGGVAPIFIGAWGAVDMIRDPYSDAASGGLRITALATMDVTVARPAQLELLTGLELETV